MTQDVIYSGNATPEIKSARGQIALSVPPWTEHTHLERATQGLDGPCLLTPLGSTAEYPARCYIEGDSPRTPLLVLLNKVTTVCTNQAELRESKYAAPCRRGCSALVFLIPSLLLCSLQEHNNLGEVPNKSIYPDVPSQPAAAHWFQGKSTRARKV